MSGSSWKVVSVLGAAIPSPTGARGVDHVDLQPERRLVVDPHRDMVDTATDRGADQQQRLDRRDRQGRGEHAP
jgi:hypothetical protein